MTRHRRAFFTLQELMMMAALGALGGVASSFISNIRNAMHAFVPTPILLQPIAGLHVLWFVIAVGLIRKPGAATVTSLLGGAVEMLSGNPHGMLVMAYSVSGGVGVDVGWWLIGGRGGKLTCAMAGGLGAASNVVVFVSITSMPMDKHLLILAGGMAVASFAGGAVVGGFLGHWLLESLNKAGIRSTASTTPPTAPATDDEHSPPAPHKQSDDG